MNRPSGPDMVRIDGSFGEGGGQILRTSLALSCVLGKPVEITNIRKARKNPGLQPQHLTAVMAAASIAGAEVQGAELSSTALQFRPNRTSGGTYHFDVAEKKGSAGSASLVLQTILLPLCFAEQASMVTVNGGTHVPWSPSFHYLRSIVAPLLFRLGVRDRVLHRILGLVSHWWRSGLRPDHARAGAPAAHRDRPWQASARLRHLGDFEPSPPYCNAPARPGACDPQQAGHRRVHRDPVSTVARQGLLPVPRCGVRAPLGRVRQPRRHRQAGRRSG